MTAIRNNRRKGYFIRFSGMPIGFSLSACLKRMSALGTSLVGIYTHDFYLMNFIYSLMRVGSLNCQD